MRVQSPSQDDMAINSSSTCTDLMTPSPVELGIRRTSRWPAHPGEGWGAWVGWETPAGVGRADGRRTPSVKDPRHGAPAAGRSRARLSSPLPGLAAWVDPCLGRLMPCLDTFDIVKAMVSGVPFRRTTPDPQQGPELGRRCHGRRSGCRCAASSRLNADTRARARVGRKPGEKNGTNGTRGMFPQVTWVTDLCPNGTRNGTRGEKRHPRPPHLDHLLLGRGGGVRWV
jgi:hypothetical protein